MIVNQVQPILLIQHFHFDKFMLKFLNQIQVMKNKKKIFLSFIRNILLLIGVPFYLQAEVIIGSLNAESGAGSGIAGIIIESQRVAVDQINSDTIGIQGEGLLKIERADTACDPISSINTVNTFINRYNPDIILGPTCSLTTLEIAKNITIPKNILLISSSASSPEISSLDDNNLVFRTISSDTQQAYALAQYLMSRQEKEVVLLYGNDPYNETLAQIFIQEYTNAGGTVKVKTQLTEKTVIDWKFINDFVDSGLVYEQPVLLMFLHGNERTVSLLEQFIGIVEERLKALTKNKIFSHHYGSDTMLTSNIRNLLYSYSSSGLHKEFTVIAQAFSQSSPEFQSYANILLNAGVNPNSPYAGFSFDTTMLAALALQHYSYNSNESISLADSLFNIANPPGVIVGPGSWETARSLILRGVDINYNGVMGPMDFDNKGDVARLYSLNQVSDENTWIVESLDPVNPIFNFNTPQIVID